VGAEQGFMRYGRPMSRRNPEGGPITAADEMRQTCVPQWMADELDHRDLYDAGTEQKGETVITHLLRVARRSVRRAQ
jgi:hypothetical protein